MKVEDCSKLVANETESLEYWQSRGGGVGNFDSSKVLHTQALKSDQLITQNWII